MLTIINPTYKVNVLCPWYPQVAVISLNAPTTKEALYFLPVGSVDYASSCTTTIIFQRDHTHIQKKRSNITNNLKSEEKEYEEDKETFRPETGVTFLK